VVIFLGVTASSVSFYGKNLGGGPFEVDVFHDGAWLILLLLFLSKALAVVLVLKFFFACWR
jgi:hypothetical protein